MNVTLDWMLTVTHVNRHYCTRCFRKSNAEIPDEQIGYSVLANDRVRRWAVETPCGPLYSVAVLLLPVISWRRICTAGWSTHVSFVKTLQSPGVPAILRDKDDIGATSRCQLWFCQGCDSVGCMALSQYGVYLMSFHQLCTKKLMYNDCHMFLCTAYMCACV